MTEHPLAGYPSEIRNSYDALMVRFPTAESIVIDTQDPEEMILISDPISYSEPGPWIVLQFIDLGRNHEYAIWKYTGDVFLTRWGEVDDDEGPLIVGYRNAKDRF